MMPVMDSTYNLYLCPKLPFPLPASSFKLLNRNLRSIGKNSFMNITKPALANEVDTREFKVMYNGRLIIDPFKPISFYTSSFFRDELGPNANGHCTFSLQKTASSTLPPLLNAMEVYMVNSLSQNETDTKEGYINNYNFLNKLFL